MNIIALCAYRNAHELLPDFLDCLVGHVDGAMMLDDGSDTRDGIGICERHPLVIASIEDAESFDHAPHSREIENRKELLKVALRRGATHVLCLDADERVEQTMLAEMRSMDGPGPLAYSVQARDLWDNADHYRTDGVWGTKRKVILFELLPFASYWNDGRLHCPWTPPEIAYRVIPTQFNLYHFGSLTAELRQARVAKFNAIDLLKKFQADYDYLANVDNLTLERIPEGRGWK